MWFKPTIKVVVVLVVVYALVVGLAWLFQRQLIYLPSTESPEVFGDVSEIALHTGDGLELAAWLVPPQKNDRDTAVLVAPGNAGNRASRLPLARNLATEGFTVLLVEYRGYGGNPGTPDEAGLVQDVAAASRYLRHEAGFDRIVYFGESLGGGVVSALATVDPPTGMLLRSPFTDLAAAGQSAYPFLPVRALLADRYPVVDNVVAAAVPLTVIVGTRDSTIPPQQSRDVADAAAEAGVEVSVVDVDADHNDASLVHGPAVVQALVSLHDRV